MNHISNVMVHLKTRSGNVNILRMNSSFITSRPGVRSTICSASQLPGKCDPNALFVGFLIPRIFF